MVNIPKKQLEKKEKKVILEENTVGELRKIYKKTTGKNASPRQRKQDLISAIQDAQKV